VAEVGILIIDDDIISQRALKHILDAEGWRVRIVPLAAHALSELASGGWNLVIVNVELVDMRGPLVAILKELVQADTIAYDGPEPAGAAAEASVAEDTVVALTKRLRALFLVPPLAIKQAVPVLEQEGLPYIVKPYHLHDFLEKVSELLLEAEAITEPIRSMSALSAGKKRVRTRRILRDGRRGTMFASREDYQMTEEELAEWEKQEEEDRKKREKERKDREHL